MCKILEDMQAEALIELVRDGVLSAASAAQRANITPEQVAERFSKNSLAIG